MKKTKTVSKTGDNNFTLPQKTPLHIAAMKVSNHILLSLR
jgi:hypothetical protein